MPARTAAPATPRASRRTPLAWRRLVGALTVTAVTAAGLTIAASAAPAAVVAGELLSQGRTATASSTAAPDAYLPGEAVDGNAGSRWQSGDGDPQWLRVDLGSDRQVGRVVLDWETARAKDYTVDISTDGDAWTTVHTSTAADPETSAGHYRKVVDLETPQTARYVRMHATARATGWNYSLYEFQVYGPSQTVADAATVEVVPTGDDTWELQVDGEPYLVKGITWGPAVSAFPQHVANLKAMGVNTIRTWGTDASSAPLLEAAAANGIRVIAGFWLAPGGGPGSGGCPDYAGFTQAQKDAEIANVTRWVQEYKVSNGVLMWDVGNESILGLGSCSSGAQLDAERAAYASLVNDIAEAIHAIDPKHPVTSTDAYVGAWPYYKQYSPALDLLGINSYQAVTGIHSAWVAGDYGKPYVITESGPDGEWEVPDDANGLPTEPTDVQKAAGYARAWKAVTDHPGQALGATMFHYGIEKDMGGVWLNVLTGGEKRLSYYELAELYGGTAAAENSTPVISSMTVPSGPVSPGARFAVSATATDPDGDTITYAVNLSGNYADGNKELVGATATATGPGAFEVTAPQTPGAWKVYVLARDGHGNVGIETRSVMVADSSTNLALHKPVTSSPDPQFPASNAVDGNAGTKWGSYLVTGTWAGRDDEWLQVDLGDVYSIDRVKLAWEGAYGKSYDILVSTDGTTWSTATQVRDQSLSSFPAWVQHTFDPVDARFVKFQGIARGTAWGYSLYEFQVFETGDGDTPTEPQGCTTDVTAGATATASSEQATVNDDRLALFAVDGVYQQNQYTPRWASQIQDGTWAGRDDEWLQVRLTQPQTICAVTIQWEGAYGKSYDIEVSSDGTDWTTATEVRDQSLTQFPATVTHTFAPVTGQYVRMKGIARGTQYGWSIYEMRVLADEGGTDPGPATAEVTATWPTLTYGAYSWLPVSVTAAGGSSTPTGTVRVREGDTVVATATLDASGNASVRLPRTLERRYHEFVVEYLGDEHTAPATLAAARVKVVKTVSTTTATAGVVRYGTGGPVTVRVSSALGSVATTGRVKLRDLDTRAVRAATLKDGRLTLRTPRLLAPGTHRFQVKYLGSPNVRSSVVVITVKVLPAASTTTAKVTRTSVTGKVVAKGVTPVTGRVKTRVTTSDGRLVATRGADLVEGRYTVTLPRLAPGSYVVTTQYQGVRTVAASTSRSTLTVR